MDGYRTLNELCGMLHIKKSTAYELMASGEIDYVEICRKRFIKEAEICEFFERRAVTKNRRHSAKRRRRKISKRSRVDGGTIDSFVLPKVANGKTG